MMLRERKSLLPINERSRAVGKFQNVVNFLGIVNDKNREAIKAMDDAIELALGFASGIGAITSAIKLAESLFGLGGPDPTQAMLQDILNKLESIDLGIKAEDLKVELSFIDQNASFTKAASIAANLSKDLKVALTDGDKSSRFEDCLAAVISLSPRDELGNMNQVWRVVHGYQIYFAPTNPWLYDGGGLPSVDFPFTYEGIMFANTPLTGNRFDPGADSTGLVFNYIFILPAYLLTVKWYLAVGVSFYPNFGQDDPGHATQVRQIADDLLWVHDIIKSGIVSIAAPSKNDLIPFTAQPLNYEIEPAGEGYTGHSYWEVATVLPSPSPLEHVDPFVLAPETDYAQPYGAVNLYSGYSSVGSYLGLGLPPDYLGNFPPPHDGPNVWPPPDWYLGFYSKYLLRTLKRNKDVYRQIGLPEVRQTINRLKTRVGDAPLVEPSFADWSLREVFNVLGYPNNHLLTGTPPLLAPLSVSNLANFLKNSPPTLASTPTSLRDMLDGLAFAHFV
jgi:hypothetical protein